MTEAEIIIVFIDAVRLKVAISTIGHIVIPE